MNLITILYRMFIILRCSSKILYEMLNDNWLVSCSFFSRIYLPIPFREVLFSGQNVTMATPYFKAFSLSPRGLPIPLYPTEDQRNLAHTSLSLGTKLSLPKHLPRESSLTPAQDTPSVLFVQKKKRGALECPFMASWYRSCHSKTR